MLSLLRYLPQLPVAFCPGVHSRVPLLFLHETCQWLLFNFFWFFFWGGGGGWGFVQKGVNISIGHATGNNYGLLYLQSTAWLR